jgi:ABC-type lipoprotein release transport system permease subunit
MPWNMITSYTPILSAVNLFMATAISIAISLFSSAYLPWRASKLKPVEVLGYG